MPVHHLNIDPAQTEIRPQDIHKLLGDEFGEVDSYTEEVIEKITADCLRCLAPQGSYIALKALKSEDPEQIAVQGISFHTGRTIRKMLSGSEDYVFMMATAGPGPETLARELLEKGDVLEGYIADLVASALVESVANQVQDHIAEGAKQNKRKSTNLDSPG